MTHKVAKTDCISFQSAFSDFQKFCSIRFVLHFNIQMTGSVLPSLGTTWIGCKFGHKMAPPATYKQICASFQRTNNRVDFKGRYNVLNFTITLHHLNWLQIWSPGGATCNSCKLALITTLHCLNSLIALNCSLGIIS